jgi:hypothetical protein
MDQKIRKKEDKRRRTGRWAGFRLARPVRLRPPRPAPAPTRVGQLSPVAGLLQLRPAAGPTSGSPQSIRLRLLFPGRLEDASPWAMPGWAASGRRSSGSASVRPAHLSSHARSWPGRRTCMGGQLPHACVHGRLRTSLAGSCMQPPPREDQASGQLLLYMHGRLIYSKTTHELNVQHWIPLLPGQRSYEKTSDGGSLRTCYR